MVLSIDSDFGSTSAALMTSCTRGCARLLQVIWQLLGLELFVRRGGFSVHGRFGEGVVGVALVGEGGGRWVGGWVVGWEEEGGGGTVADCGRTVTTPASHNLPDR